MRRPALALLSLVPTVRRLRWKIALVFGRVTLLAVGAASFISHATAEREFRASLGAKLESVSAVVAGHVDPGTLASVADVESPEWAALRAFLFNLRSRLNLSWIGIYRHNGEFFTCIADGSERGEGFTLDMPILDAAPELVRAWREGVPVAADEYEDAYGSWKSFFRPVKDAGGRVIAVVDVSESNESLERYTRLVVRKTAIVIAAVGTVTLLVCILFAGTLTRPIARLTEGARRMAGGDLAARVDPPGGGDEIARLVDAFNGMGDELEAGRAALSRRIGELQALYEVSRQANAARDTRDLMRVVLERALAASHAARGSVLLFDEEAASLVLEVAAGAGCEGAKAGIRIAEGEGVAGEAFRTREAVMLNDPAEIALCFKAYEDGTTGGTRSILCVPLVVEDRAIGVLNLVNKADGPFVAGDLSLIATMAAQIALTIEKARLYDLSITDGLTGLYLHRFFQIALDREIKRARRYGSPVSLLLFDIDHFKSFNDTWGHQQGDLVIAGVAQVVRRTVREQDLAARYGGEEFAVILPETDAAGAMDAAERIRRAVEAHAFPGRREPLRVTVSLGAAQFPLHAGEKDDLIRAADAALYRSKEAGRNRSSMAAADGAPADAA